MASFNRVILLGNLTRDPELRYIASGTRRDRPRPGGERSPQERQRRMGRGNDVCGRDALGAGRRKSPANTSPRARRC